MLRGALLLALVTCLFLGARFNLSASAQLEGDSAVSFMSENYELANQYSIEEIEQAISELNLPIDAEKIGLIQSAINALGQNEREHLSQVLRKHMDGLFKINNTASEVPEESYLFEKNAVQNQPISHDDIMRQINGLKLGPNATTADLRERDKIIGVIAGIEDPAIRYQLLEHLEAREKESNGNN